MLVSTVHGCLSFRPYVSLPRIRGHVIKTARRMLSPELALVLSQDSMPASRVPISLVFLHLSCAGFVLCAGQVRRSSMASLRPHLNSCQNWLSEWVHLSPTSMVRLALLLTPSGVSTEVPAWRGLASRHLTPRAHLSLTILPTPPHIPSLPASQTRRLFLQQVKRSPSPLINSIFTNSSLHKNSQNFKITIFQAVCVISTHMVVKALLTPTCVP